MKISGSVGERFLIYKLSSQTRALEKVYDADVVAICDREHCSVTILKIERPGGGPPANAVALPWPEMM